MDSMTGSNSLNSHPVACSLTAPELRARRDQALAVFRRANAKLAGLADGYRIQFVKVPGVIADVASFIEAESQCCPFLTFHLTVEPGGGAMRLDLTGPSGTREFLAAELGIGELQKG
jgi:hypothetical protein